jgi:hypothetical protein
MLRTNGLKLKSLVVVCMCRDVKAGNVYCKTTKRFDVISTRKLWNFLPVHCRWSHKKNHSLSLSTVAVRLFSSLLACRFVFQFHRRGWWLFRARPLSPRSYTFTFDKKMRNGIWQPKSQPAYVIFSKPDDNNKGWNKRHPHILDASLVHLFHSSQFLML